MIWKSVALLLFVTLPFQNKIFKKNSKGSMTLFDQNSLLSVDLRKYVLTKPEEKIV